MVTAIDSVFKTLVFCGENVIIKDVEANKANKFKEGP
jgi:hypothetical protein